MTTRQTKAGQTEQNQLMADLGWKLNRGYLQAAFGALNGRIFACPADLAAHLRRAAIVRLDHAERFVAELPEDVINALIFDECACCMPEQSCRACRQAAARYTARTTPEAMDAAERDVIPF